VISGSLEPDFWHCFGKAQTHRVNFRARRLCVSVITVDNYRSPGGRDKKISSLKFITMENESSSNFVVSSAELLELKKTIRSH
jgi:hypothetical protein